MLKRRDILVKVETLKAERNTVSAEIAQARRNKEKNADDKIAGSKPYLLRSKPWCWIGEMLSWWNLHHYASKHPCWQCSYCGADEDDNVKFAIGGTPREFDFEAKAHWDLGEDLWYPLTETMGKR